MTAVTMYVTVMLGSFLVGFLLGIAVGAWAVSRLKK